MRELLAVGVWILGLCASVRAQGAPPAPKPPPAAQAAPPAKPQDPPPAVPARLWQDFCCFEKGRMEKDGLVTVVYDLSHTPSAPPNVQGLEEFQKLGYPVFSQSTLPMDPDVLERLFGDEVRAGVIRNPLEIQDVWKNSYSANTNQKVWAAKFTARHPNLVALELSSFKCGHDAPIYSVVEGIIEKSGTPYFSFKDIDENKPSGSIRIRVETIHYFLKRYVEDMQKRPLSSTDIDRQLAEFENRLRNEMLREAELAALAHQQQEAADKLNLSGRLLPVINSGGPPASQLGA